MKGCLFYFLLQCEVTQQMDVGIISRILLFTDSRLLVSGYHGDIENASRTAGISPLIIQCHVTLLDCVREDTPRLIVF
ncbi:hypothetical protein JOB18_009297 [Solea senegalensis]|uniref:Uncharacterized protein n=1 Tax=Solea senegalensis TaxID=28829 RepID=A0AAV6T438_SOLSE|nr:hypothetical protein JOB18_009297 [Solea senegalensis]